jgi:hypothetical protein
LCGLRAVEHGGSLPLHHCCAMVPLPFQGRIKAATLKILPRRARGTGRRLVEG